MIIKFILSTVIIIVNFIYVNGQSSISINTEYSIGELSSNEDYEYGYNIHLDYSMNVKPWMSYKIGMYFQQEEFNSGGAYWAYGDVKIDGELLDNVSRRVHAQGEAKTLLFTSGVQFNKYGFSTSVFGGTGMSTVSSDWYYRITRNGEILTSHRFEEDYETKPTWLLGLKLAYSYPVTDRLNIGVSATVRMLDSAERSVSNTVGTYMPEEYYNPELTKKSAANYGDYYVFSGFLIEFKL